MRSCKLLPSVMAAMLAAGALAVPAHAQGTGIVIDDIDLVGLNYDPVAGLLSATGGTVTGTAVGLPFTTDVQNFVLQLGNGGDACSILNLELGPIDLDLLGLHVDTSAICLDITAFEDQGILGDLLCDLAGGNLLLLPDLLDALEAMLTDTLAQETGDGGGPQDICDGKCEILDLAVGPIDLTLLGVNIHLDNCDDGPVQVCVSASEGEGLLGDLLCGLAGGGALLDLDNLTALLNAILGIDGLGDIDATPQEIARLVRIIEHALRDGTLSDRELDRIVRAIERLI